MNFENEFKDLRHRLNYLINREVFISCMNKFIDIWGIDSNDLITQQQTLPMTLFTLMKWGMIYGISPIMKDFVGYRNFDDAAFNQLYRIISDLPSQHSFLEQAGDPYSIDKLFRAKLSYQLRYQEKNGFYGLALLDVIFNRIGINYDSDQVLNEICGLTVSEFLDLQFVVLGAIQINKRYVAYQPDFWSAIYSEHSKEKIESFLNFMSLDLNEVRSFFQADSGKIDNPEFDCSLISPLYKKPLYREEGKYLPYHASLLKENIEFGLYNLLKEHDPGGFGGAFGDAFEDYFAQSITENEIEFLREEDIQGITHKDRSCDFLIPSDGSTVFVEVKSNEMYRLTPLDPQREYLARTLKESVIKGYQQIFQTADYLRLENSDYTDNKKMYGIIITYKDMFLGSPMMIWSEFMDEMMQERLDEELYSSLPLPPENIFVMNAYSFDHLLNYRKRKECSLADCLSKAVENKQNPENMRLFFQDHFTDIPLRVIETLLLKDSIDNIMDRLKEAAKRYENQNGNG